jgi:hypothetical protein
MGEQLPDPLREQRGAARRDQDAGRAVEHGVHLAADRAKSRYSWDRIAHETLAVYDTALAA